jgi:pimeloyl-ACP methyl ester carboxylesterase
MDSRLLKLVPGILLCIVLTIVAAVLEAIEVRLFHEPYLEALVLAIILGVVVRSFWTPGLFWDDGIRFSSKILLENVVVLVGASISVATVVALAGAALIVGPAAHAASLESTSATTTYHSMTIDGVGVFYREAGPKDAPTLVLLHGFPSSSREFDTLIPLLATHYRLIAPDFPGFGQSDAPPPSSYVYTFDQLAKTIGDLLEQLKISKCSFYLHDYGGPVGFRIILAHPERVQALIIQNANAYREGLGAKWTGIAQYWADPKAHPEVFDAFVSLAATEQRHALGTSHPDRYNPDTWTDEYAHLSKPGQHEIQAALLYDYRTNVASYPAWQAWLRDHKPPTLVIWGRNDPSFIAPGAEAFKRDLPNAEIHLLDAGHFALDEKNDEIAGLILTFLARHSD